jgi:hypothetical protein
LFIWAYANPSWLISKPTVPVASTPKGPTRVRTPALGFCVYRASV